MSVSSDGEHYSEVYATEVNVLQSSKVHELFAWICRTRLQQVYGPTKDDTWMMDIAVVVSGASCSCSLFLFCFRGSRSVRSGGYQVHELLRGFAGPGCSRCMAPSMMVIVGVWPHQRWSKKRFSRS